MSERLQKLADISAYLLLGMSALCGVVGAKEEIDMTRSQGAAAAYHDVGEITKAEMAEQNAGSAQDTRNAALSASVLPLILGGAGVVKIIARSSAE